MVLFLGLKPGREADYNRDTTSSQLTTMNNPDFSAINRRSAQSYIEHKHLIKNLLAGRTVPCRHCGQPLQAQLPVAGSENAGYIRCAKGCTDIELEASLPLR